MSYKPQGHPDVSPYLIAADAGAVLRFLTEVFNAEITLTSHRDDGSLAHAELRIGDSVIMIGGLADAAQSSAHVHVYRGDVDTVYAKAVAAGARSVQAPVQKDDPDRRAGVQDPSGTTWWIATRQGGAAP
ncbi:MAG: VOC family protein [Pseudomonadota bacterium]